ncbi:hypothetical protein EJ06DRAFT_531976 [Trichodelitschia bisporula]|uniref:Mid2 domain-containing protein n=1 Tax=Trichodelitschia bisporula TaxID=703511 RepID=A0A6G1HS79_9PEZI|nr:hypothetical protein EJ06DRAFT_531976 [Trichodelitschia bisporula]
MNIRSIILSALFSTLAMAQAKTSSSASAFPTMSAQDGSGVQDGGAGSVLTGTTPGADGSDKGAFSLSRGAIVGMCVAIGLVVLIIGGLWWLWYMAKKKQWDIRGSLRRASRRLTGRRDTTQSARSTNRRGTVFVQQPPASKKRTTGREPDLEAQKPKPATKVHVTEKEAGSSRGPSEDDPVQVKGWGRFGGK